MVEHQRCHTAALQERRRPAGARGWSPAGAGLAPGSSAKWSAAMRLHQTICSCESSSSTRWAKPRWPTGTAPAAHARARSGGRGRSRRAPRGSQSHPRGRIARADCARSPFEPVDEAQAAQAVHSHQTKPWPPPAAATPRPGRVCSAVPARPSQRPQRTGQTASQQAEATKAQTPCPKSIHQHQADSAAACWSAGSRRHAPSPS